MMNETTQSGIFVIFGGTGDLARRKILPALGKLETQGHLQKDFHVVAVARDRRSTDVSFREVAMESMGTAGLQAAGIHDFVQNRFHYQSIGDGSLEDFRGLARRIEQIEREHRLIQNRAFYLALPTEAVPVVVANLGAVGLNTSDGWTRIVIEKPFGRDLTSAKTLNGRIHSEFAEEQIYRIDHYLGKETVQNLLAFRFANGFLESLWNREHIEEVHLTVAESLGVGTRAGYYDRSGAVRDMVQNHLSQLLALMAMEPPFAFTADAIRQEKIKALRSIMPISMEDVVYGQYGSAIVGGEKVPGYLEEEGILGDSSTETFVAMRLDFENWRWQGVPFYLRTGKYLPRKLTQVAIRFKSAPVCMFQSKGACIITHNVLILTLQPDEGFTLHIDVKKPGAQFELERVPLSFKYSDRFGEIPDAYETLLLDVLLGDQTLFVHGEEVEESWRLFEPLVKRDHPVYTYPAGSSGPKEASRFCPPEVVRGDSGGVGEVP
jgi:glucose-6-phosphate 1-dehydrogenase